MTISQFLQLLPSQGNHITMPVWVVEIVGWEFIISLFHLMEKKTYNSEMLCESLLSLLARKTWGQNLDPDFELLHGNLVLQ